MESLGRINSIIRSIDSKVGARTVDLTDGVSILCGGFSGAKGTAYVERDSDHAIESCKRVVEVLNGANEATGHNDGTLTEAVQRLCNGYAEDAPLYSFGAISDTHIQYGDVESDGDRNGVNDLQRALPYLDERVEFICVCGDLVAFASNDYMNQYKSVINDATLTTKPVYECAGNHETYPEQGVIGSIDKALWEDVTGWASHKANGCVGDSLYYCFTRGNDVFIMLSLVEAEPYAVFADGALDWLQGVLETNRNKRCFVFQHVHDPNDASADPSHSYSDMLKGADGVRFVKLMKHYKNAVWFHGHTHKSIDWDVNGGVPVPIVAYPVSTNNGYKSVHIPSLQGSRYYDTQSNALIPYYYKYNDAGNIIVDSSGNPIQYQGGTHAEGYIVDVYASKIVIRGIDFAVLNFTADWQAYYTVEPMAGKTFVLNTALQNIAAGTFEE